MFVAWVGIGGDGAEAGGGGYVDHQVGGEASGGVGGHGTATGGCVGDGVGAAGDGFIGGGISQIIDYIDYACDAAGAVGRKPLT